MEKVYCSILNDVIGPVMMGPSSSHTAGPCRIANMARALLGEEIVEAEIVFDKQSSYAATYRGQGSDYGFLGGLLGMMPEDTQLADARRLATERGLRFTFTIDELADKHPNAALLRLRGARNILTVLSHSLGGSMYEIVALNGFPLRITGECDICVVIYRGSSLPARHLPHFEQVGVKEFHTSAGGVLLLEAIYPLDEARVSAMEADPDCITLRYVRTDVAVKKFEKQTLPFTNAAAAQAYADEHGLALWQLAVAYECAVGVTDERAMLNNFLHKLDVMAAAAAAGLAAAPGSRRKGFLPPVASTMKDNSGSRTLADMGVLNEVMLWAVAVMEHSGKPGVVVAAPTAGSCGVLPATVLCIGEQLGKSREEIARALFAAGLVGAFIGNDATFAGDISGCQAEIGAAAAMAAAGLVALLNGTVREAFAAASLAMQNMLGLVCDPVACQTETPCIGRNSGGAATAVMAANMVISGFDAVIPLDETIGAMMAIGGQMDPSLLCTGRAGLCVTKTGRAIAARVAAEAAEQ